MSRAVSIRQIVDDEDDQRRRRCVFGRVRQHGGHRVLARCIRAEYLGLGVDPEGGRCRLHGAQIGAGERRRAGGERRGNLSLQCSPDEEVRVRVNLGEETAAAEL